MGDRPGRPGGVVRRTDDMVVGQAQPALLLGGQWGRWGNGPAPMLARDRRAAPLAIDRGKVGTDASERPRRAWLAGGRRYGARDGVDRGHARRIAGRGRPGRRPGHDPLAAQRKRKNPGDDLFSRKAALSVSSAL